MAKKPPKYCQHKASGQAFVYINRKPQYLGEYNSPDSHRRYREVVAAWCKDIELEGVDLTIAELVNVYFANHVASHYRKNGKPTSEVSAIESATRILVKTCGDLPVVSFKPKKLKAVREAMISAGWKRTSINKQVGRIRLMFSWAVGDELLPVEILVGLRTVQPLEKGRSDAVEPEPVLPVPDNHIELVRNSVSDPIQAIIDLQLLTGARPTEIIVMRLCDIQMNSDVWQYRPAEHKTEHHGKQRVVYLGPKSQLIVRRFMTNKTDAYLFSPRLARFTNKNAREKYDVQTYRKSINRACRRAKIQEWSPNRLRHNAGTRIRKEFGAEAAQIILGHAKLSTTEVYAERDESKAVEIMRKTG